VECPARGPYKARDIIWSGPAKATAGGTRNSINLGAFEAKLRLWKVQLEGNNTVHFPTLEGQKPSKTLEYSGECAKLFEAFN
jgi:hypothetical protein